MKGVRAQNRPAALPASRHQRAIRPSVQWCLADEANPTTNLIEVDASGYTPGHIIIGRYSRGVQNWIYYPFFKQPIVNKVLAVKMDGLQIPIRSGAGPYSWAAASSYIKLTGLTTYFDPTLVTWNNQPTVLPDDPSLDMYMEFDTVSNNANIAASPTLVPTTMGYLDCRGLTIYGLKAECGPTGTYNAGTQVVGGNGFIWIDDSVSTPIDIIEKRSSTFFRRIKTDGPHGLYLGDYIDVTGLGDDYDSDTQLPDWFGEVQRLVVTNVIDDDEFEYFHNGSLTEGPLAVDPPGKLLIF